MRKINPDEMDEQMPNFWVKTGLREPLTSRIGRYVNTAQFRTGTILSGSPVSGQVAYKLEARYVEEEQRLKFRLYKEHMYRNMWEEVPVNPDNTILYGMPHYIDNVEPNQVDKVVGAYFEEFREHVESRK